MAQSNVKCLKAGGAACKLNFEVTKRYTIIVRSINAADLSQYIDCKPNIDLTDVNDSPRSLTLTGRNVTEGMPVGTIVGKLFSVVNYNLETEYGTVMLGIRKFQLSISGFLY